jgi:hypothetical protein
MGGLISLRRIRRPDSEERRRWRRDCASDYSTEEKVQRRYTKGNEPMREPSIGIQASMTDQTELSSCSSQICLRAQLQ